VTHPCTICSALTRLRKFYCTKLVVELITRPRPLLTPCHRRVIDGLETVSVHVRTETLGFTMHSVSVFEALPNCSLKKVCCNIVIFSFQIYAPDNYDIDLKREPYKLDANDTIIGRYDSVQVCLRMQLFG
jgi:hypothetical protein